MPTYTGTSDIAFGVSDFTSVTETETIPAYNDSTFPVFESQTAGPFFDTTTVGPYNSNNLTSGGSSSGPLSYIAGPASETESTPSNNQQTSEYFTTESVTTGQVNAVGSWP